VDGQHICIVPKFGMQRVRVQIPWNVEALVPYSGHHVGGVPQFRGHASLANLAQWWQR
jgi:hypothetical protein